MQSAVLYCYWNSSVGPLICNVAVLLAWAMCWVSSKVITRIISTESLQLDTKFRCLFKSTTLDDLECHYALLFRNSCFFSVHHEYLNKDTRTIADENTGARIITAVEVLYGYHDRSVETGRQPTMGLSKMTILCSTVTRYLSRIFTGKAPQG